MTSQTSYWNRLDSTGHRRIGWGRRKTTVLSKLVEYGRLQRSAHRSYDYDSTCMSLRWLIMNRFILVILMKLMSIVLTDFNKCIVVRGSLELQEQK